ncbi:MAG: hypothetical protein K6T83_23345, partial [Alicyclobacillus sp.]|nr:hypothetical protein [Alicyclobacillus sp.]
MPNAASGERLMWRLALVVSASVFFGAIMSIIKGNDVGLRDAIGNMSAPWLSLPFVAAVYAKLHRPVQGALVGLLATVCALTGFYFMNSFVLDLSPHPWLEKLGLTMRSGWFYFLLGFLSGPIWGFLGGWY